jgi:hypothetical protein
MAILNETTSYPTGLAGTLNRCWPRSPFPAWCLGHDPSAQILCVSYAQDLADKLARDCRAG